MSKKDKNTLECTSGKQLGNSSWDKLKRSMRIAFVIGFSVFFVLAFFSWGCKLFCDSHLFSCLYKCWYPDAFQAKGAYEVVKAIGLCSLIVPWIYKKWDELSFGLPYKRYIDKNFKLYKLMSVAQILVTLLCLAASGDGVRECAWLSLAAVIFGLAYQWCVFSELILRDELRIRLAPELWKQDICGKSDSIEWDKLIYLASLYSSSAGQDKQVFCQCLGSCLVELWSDETRDCTSETDLHRLSEVWSQILSETRFKEECIDRISDARFNQTSELLNQILKGPDKVEGCKRDSIIEQLSAAYTVSLLLQNDLRSDIKDMEPLLGIFNSQSDSDNMIFFRKVHHTFVVTCWALFLLGQTELQHVHVSMPYDTPGNVDRKITETVVKLICRCYAIPLQDDFKRKVEIAINLTDKSLKVFSEKASGYSTLTPNENVQEQKPCDDGDDDDDSIEQETHSEEKVPVSV